MTDGATYKWVKDEQEDFNDYYIMSQGYNRVLQDTHDKRSPI